jgi:NADH-quinone oxidoreductase subunit L/NAD(P)H-quinone oxidoreductase subunit 5
MLSVFLPGGFDASDVLAVAIAGLPLLAAACQAVRAIGSPARRAAAGTIAVGGAFALALVGLAAAADEPARGLVLDANRLRAVMLVLVTGIATIVHAFARRSMDSDPGYARFFVWLGIVTAAVVAVVEARSLIVLPVAWACVSIALYRLQTHYGDRPAARAAARPLRTALIAGDCALAAGCAILAAATHTLDLDAALAAAPGLAQGTAIAVAALVAIAAFSKSSQMPLHRWLPETMEAPTPVSALMHAGIVNAGGFLLAVFAPLLARCEPVAIAIFVAGTATALWGSSCMLVRPDVKRGLAYSTMGQMGYMTMQCGLGAYAAAILHLCAHGIFKATLFLGSGYAVHAHKDELRGPAIAANERVGNIEVRRASAVLATLGIAVIVGVSPLGRALPPYGWALLAFATLTCMQAARSIASAPGGAAPIAAQVPAAVLLPAYVGLVVGFERFLVAPGAAGAMQVPAPLVAAAIALFAAAQIAGWGIVRVPEAWRDRIYVWLLSERLPLARSR